MRKYLFSDLDNIHQGINKNCQFGSRLVGDIEGKEYVCCMSFDDGLEAIGALQFPDLEFTEDIKDKLVKLCIYSHKKFIEETGFA